MALWTIPIFLVCHVGGGRTGEAAKDRTGEALDLAHAGARAPDARIQRPTVLARHGTPPGRRGLTTAELCRLVATRVRDRAGLRNRGSCCSRARAFTSERLRLLVLRSKWGIRTARGMTRGSPDRRDQYRPYLVCDRLPAAR